MRREFIQYWQENFKAAKELSEFWAAVVLLGLFIVGLAARFFGFPNPSEILTLDVKVELAGICLTAFLCFIWLPFHTHSVKKREHSKQLADIIANKDAEIQKLQIQLNKLQTTINDDAPKLTVNAGLFLFQDPVGTPYLVLEAKIVNAGKKLVRVEKVVYFTRSTLPTLHGPFEEFLVCANFSSTPTVDLEPDGDLHFWRTSYIAPTHFATQNENGNDVGFGYVQLGIGTKFHFTFPLPTPEQLKILGTTT